MATLDSIQLRESYGIGAVNHSGRPFVRFEEYRPADRILERVRSRLEEQLREQLHEQLYGGNTSLLNTRNHASEPTRVSLSGYLYTGEHDSSSFDHVDTEMFSFEMENGNLNVEFKNALLEEVQNMSAEYGLERREMMFILNPEGYEMLFGARNFVSHFMGIEIHISYDQIELYKVLVKGVKGHDIALTKARKLR